MSRAAAIRPLRQRPPRNAALLSLAVCLFCAPSVFGETDAKAIMAGVYQQDTSRDAKLRATLDVTDKDGHTVRKRFTLLRIGSFGNGKTLVRFTDPQELRGVALLSINQPGVTDRQWIYTPATERVRSVAPRERSERFAGSDFTYEDIAEPPLDDFTYQLLPAGDSIENHKTFKVQATPVAPDRSQYKFIYYWVAQDVPCILHAEMYDQEGRKVREMHATGLRKEAGIWGARKTEMRSLLEGTKSVLTIDEIHLNSGLDSALFTPETLEKKE
ncbi:MAG TPA: outer membrane lipoprotein-sorting protein [Candidatus Acidoferrales bacterium]|nr:outer membrane lipoprotein-sorting protein [Candidatus Acidoferrales bacterium]